MAANLNLELAISADDFVVVELEVIEIVLE